MRRSRRLAVGALVVALVTAAAVLAVALRGEYELVGPRFIDRPGSAAPAWAGACRAVDRRLRRPYILRCARVKGTVVWTEEQDPDGDGDRHVVVLAGLRLVKVKYRRDVAVGFPGVGSTVEAAGRAPAGGGSLDTIDVAARAAPRE